MGWMAGLAGLAFGAALVTLATFFATHDERFDRVAEWCFAAFAVLAIPAMVAVTGRFPEAGVAIGIVTAVGIAGVAVVGLGELASTLRLVDFRRIAPAVTLGFLAFLAWIGGVSVLIVIQGGLPLGLGWLGIVSILAAAAIVAWIMTVPGVMTGEREPRRAQMTLFFVPMVGIVAWMIWLGLSL